MYARMIKRVASADSPKLRPVRRLSRKIYIMWLKDRFAEFLAY